MKAYSDLALDTFLKNQEQLFDEPVAENREEAAEFLEECMAQVVSGIRDVRKYLDGMGMDVSDMDDRELLSQSEIFPRPDGQYLIVEG